MKIKYTGGLRGGVNCVFERKHLQFPNDKAVDVPDALAEEWLVRPDFAPADAAAQRLATALEKAAEEADEDETPDEPADDAEDGEAE